MATHNSMQKDDKVGKKTANKKERKKKENDRERSK